MKGDDQMPAAALTQDEVFEDYDLGSCVPNVFLSLNGERKNTPPMNNSVYLVCV